MSYLSNMTDIFLATLAGLVVTLVTAWLAIRIATRLNLMDFPGVLPHKQHLVPTPYAGGIALLFSLVILSVHFGCVESEWAGRALPGTDGNFYFWYLG